MQIFGFRAFQFIYTHAERHITQQMSTMYCVCA